MLGNAIETRLQGCAHGSAIQNFCSCQLQGKSRHILSGIGVKTDVVCIPFICHEHTGDK